MITDFKKSFSHGDAAGREVPPSASAPSFPVTPSPPSPSVPSPPSPSRPSQPPLLAQHPPSPLNTQNTSAWPAPPVYFDEVAYQTSVQELDTALEAYTQSRRKMSRPLRREMETNIEASMRNLAATHPDPAVKQSWATRASTFAAGTSKVQHVGFGRAVGMTAKGLAIICLLPIRITGGALMVAGGIVTGTGQLIAGTGKALDKVGRLDFSRSTEVGLQ